MGKLATPDWIKEGFDSKADWEKSHGSAKKKKKTDSGKTFKVKKCPECGSYDVNVVLSEQEVGDEDEESSSGKSAGDWECKKCKWNGKDVEEEELTEDEFMKYLDEKGESVA